jgi:hypothetical protein
VGAWVAEGLASCAKVSWTQVSLAIRAIQWRGGKVLERDTCSDAAQVAGHVQDTAVAAGCVAR